MKEFEMVETQRMHLKSIIKKNYKYLLEILKTR